MAATDVVIADVSNLKIDEDAKQKLEEESQDKSAQIDSKQKKKLDKMLESILKRNGGSAIAIEEKYYLLAQKFFDQQEQLKKVQGTVKDAEKQASLAVKSKEQAQADYTKALLAKNQLESLCRELQRVNKEIKEENLQRIKEEEEKRKEITTRFQSAIDEINQQVNANTEKNQTLIQENSQLAEKLKSLVDQYELREQHVEKVLKHKDLEAQLADAKFQQSELKLNELIERSKKEKEIYEGHIADLSKKCVLHEETDKQLRAQLAIYTTKYEEFQQTLTKSNSVFETFRTEMDKMNKKMKKLEQETNTWKGKYENCAKSLASISENKEFLEKEIKKYQNKAEVMEQLSRKLQTERNSFLQEIKQLKGVADDSKQEPDTSKSVVAEPESAGEPAKAAESAEQKSESGDKQENKAEMAAE